MQTRREILAGLGAAGLAAIARPASAAYAPPEQPGIKIGTSVTAMSFLPVYVAAARTWKAQGLDVQLFQFRGDAEAAQALAGGSIDVMVGSLNGLINMINSSQPVIGVYGGFWNADFSFHGGAGVKTWADLKGKSMGISTYGSLTDALTRFALKHNHLDPEKDVQIQQIGNTVNTYEAIKSGRIGGGILSPPYSWQADDDGMTRLGTQSKDVAPYWPKHMISAKTAFIAAHPHTIEAVLRGHVAAIRLAKKDKPGTVQIMMDQLKISQAFAQKAVELELPYYDERGGMPEKSMPVFWDITKQLGDVKSAWPEDKYLDHRFINSFKTWAPA